MNRSVEHLAAKVAGRPLVDGLGRRHERHVVSDAHVLDIVTYVDQPKAGEPAAENEVEIWFNGEEDDFDGPIVGVGRTRAEAAVQAVDALSNAIAILKDWRA